MASRLGPARGWDRGEDFPAWRFGSVRHWGESAVGAWTLRVADRAAQNVGTWDGWTLRLYGVERTSQSLVVARVGAGVGSVDSPVAGIACGDTCSASVPYGTSVTLVATPAAGSRFAGWDGPCTGLGSCTVSMDQAQNVTATFTRHFALAVGKSGTGTGSVNSSPTGIACGSNCNMLYSYNTVVTLTAAPTVTATSGSIFTGWSGECVGTGACTVTMDAARSVIATFIPGVPLTLTQPTHGSVTATGVACGTGGTDCAEAYTSGSTITLTATPAPGYTVDTWIGCGSVSPDKLSCTVSMDGARNVAVTFAAPSFAFTVTKAGPGTGTVTSTPTGIACGSTCTADLPQGSGVILSAVPAPGSTFTGWSGDCAGTAHCILTLEGPRTVAASFATASLPEIHLGLPAGAIGLGNSMPVTTTVTPGAPVVADVHVALELPDASLLFLAPGGGLAPLPTPFVANWPVAAYTGPVFTRIFTGAEPAGAYRWLAALMAPGTLTPLTGITEASASVWPAPPPALGVYVSARTFRPGDVLAIGLTLDEASAPADRDVYVAIQLPDDSLLFIAEDGTATPTAMPYLRHWDGTALVRKAFAYPFTGGEPLGPYKVLAAFTAPGSMTFLGPILSAPFSFAP